MAPREVGGDRGRLLTCIIAISCGCIIAGGIADAETAGWVGAAAGPVGEHGVELLRLNVLMELAQPSIEPEPAPVATGDTAPEVWPEDAGAAGPPAAAGASCDAGTGEGATGGAATGAAAAMGGRGGGPGGTGGCI